MTKNLQSDRVIVIIDVSGSVGGVFDMRSNQLDCVVVDRTKLVTGHCPICDEGELDDNKRCKECGHDFDGIDDIGSVINTIQNIDG